MPHSLDLPLFEEMVMVIQCPCKREIHLQCWNSSSLPYFHSLVDTQTLWVCFYFYFPKPFPKGRKERGGWRTWFLTVVWIRITPGVFQLCIFSGPIPPEILTQHPWLCRGSLLIWQVSQMSLMQVASGGPYFEKPCSAFHNSFAEILSQSPENEIYSF